jgi:hypothetical protein
MLRRRSRVVAEMNSIASLSLVMPSRREAMLVVSPIAVYSTRCSEPTLTQAEGSEVVSGTDGTESISGTLKGDIFTYHSSVGGYEAQVTLTVAANGLSWSGPLHDNNGTSGTDTAHRNTPLGSGKPSPVLAKTGNVATVSGRVQVKPPGSRSFVALSKLRQIPFGTIVNATNGTVGVTTATPSGATQTGKFFGGEFVLTQGGSGMVLATLTGGSFSACPTAPERSRIARAGTASAQATASGSHTVRKLWANAHGKFSTKGNYAAAAVQGTEWLTEDLCEGTLIRVTRDKVAVTNLVNHRHVEVRAGHHYLAKAP